MIPPRQITGPHGLNLAAWREGRAYTSPRLARAVVASILVFVLAVATMVPTDALNAIAVGLAIWTGLGALVAIPLCRIIAHADRNRAREQADRQPVGERSGQGGINFHKGASA